jgi:hypothetical protein
MLIFIIIICVRIFPTNNFLFLGEKCYTGGRRGRVHERRGPKRKKLCAPFANAAKVSRSTGTIGRKMGNQQDATFTLWTGTFICVIFEKMEMVAERKQRKWKEV